jgi:hypothetical protein
LKAEYGLNFDLDGIVIDDSETTDPDFIAMSSKEFAKLSGWQKYKKLVTVWCSKLDENSFLVLDHWTNIGKLLVAYMVGKNKHSMYQSDWQEWIEEMDSLLGLLKQSSTKCSSIIIAHEEHLKDDITGNIIRFILTPTKMRFSFASYPTEYLYMKAIPSGAVNARKIDRLLQARMDQNTAAGSYSNMPDITNPTFEKMRPYLERALGHKLPPATWTPPEGK